MSDDMTTEQYMLVGALSIGLTVFVGLLFAVVGDALAHAWWGAPKCQQVECTWGDLAWRAVLGVGVLFALAGGFLGGSYATGRGVVVAYHRTAAWYRYLSSGGDDA